MQKNQINKGLFAAAAFVLAGAAGAQSAPPAGLGVAPAGAVAVVAPVQSYTLGDLADMARDVEFEKQRRALREAKGAEIVKAPPPMPVKKKVKAAPKPITPEGLQVRAIFGTVQNETIRFFTNVGKFEDHHLGEMVQGWTIIHVADEGVILQKGKIVYPLAIQMRPMPVESADGAEPEPAAFKNVVHAGPLPSPKLASGQ